MIEKYLKRTATCLLLTIGGASVSWAQVAQIGTTKYNSLTEAFASSEANGGTVMLTSDIELTNQIVIRSTTSTILDLNGHSIKGSNTVDGNIFINDGALTLKDSKEGSTAKIYSETSYSGNDTGKCLIVVSGKGTFTMESGYIYTVNKTNATAYGNFAVGVQEGGNVIINGGTIEAGWYAVAGNGQDKETTSNVTINGGTLISTADYAIYNPQNGNVTVNGGTIYGNAGGISMKRGELTVNGGTITSKGQGNTGTWGDGTGGLSNAALIFDQPNANIKAIVNGGTITAQGDAVSVKNSKTATTDLVIKGGTFSGETASIEPYIDESSMAKTEDGKVTVQADYYKAKVGETKYTTLDEAINAATDGQTVVLYDIDEPTKTYTVAGKSLTFDLNGSTVNLNSITADNGATLTFVDNTATAEPTVSDDYKTVTYSAGTMTLTSGLKAQNGSGITVNSGKYVNTKGNLLSAIGDTTGASEIKSTVTVDGGYLESQEFTITPQGKGAVANVNGGVLVARDNAVVAGHGTNTATEKRGGTTINITGGTMIGKIQSAGYVACGVYHPQEGKLNISGGKIVALGGSGILMRGGQLNQTGGEVIATGDAALTGKVGDSRVVVGTSGIIFDRDANYYDAVNTTVEVSGEAKVSGTKAAIEVLNTKAVAGAEDVVTVKGGTFSSDVSEFCEDGAAAAPNQDGTYGVVTGDIVMVYSDGSKTAVATEKALEFSTDKLTRLLVNQEVTDATVKMTRNFTTTNWNSFYVPFDITVTEDMLQKFAFAELWDTELVNDATTLEFKLLTAGGKIEANTPCLIKALTTGDNVLELTGTTVKKTSDVSQSECSTLKQKFNFYGVYENTTLLDKHGYFLNPKDNKFHDVDQATAYIAPTKFYMTVQNKSDNSYDYPANNQSAAKTISFIVNGDETNGISEVKNDADGKALKIYNLQGVYMGSDKSALPAGAYIVNGKKMILK